MSWSESYGLGKLIAVLLVRGAVLLAVWTVGLVLCAPILESLPSRGIGILSITLAVPGGLIGWGLSYKLVESVGFTGLFVMGGTLLTAFGISAGGVHLSILLGGDAVWQTVLTFVPLVVAGIVIAFMTWSDA